MTPAAGAWPQVPHGADLERARRLYPEPRGGWLDLSTGINPRPWPAAAAALRFGLDVWRDLPTPDAGLLTAFEGYYGAGAWPVPGSQAVIQALPRVWRRLHGTARCRVLAPGYGEHAARWALEGHEVVLSGVDDMGQGDAEVRVLARPNNPTGDSLGIAPLRELASRSRLLVVDEAFLDVSGETSMAAEGLPNVVVLRSLGKFFGLAGLRVGAVLGDAPWLAALRAEIGPWSVNGPGLHLAAAALRDVDWQREARGWLTGQSLRLGALLDEAGLPHHGTPLFRTVATPRARALHEGLARRGLWTRLFELDAPRPWQALRLGLPGDAAGLERLAEALYEINRQEGQT
ncbi:aminotransferase class I/II-fold pyridoxal phosphate-dependent enzyme [Aquabacterium sp. A7-Y]|uniref:threonine-phosphate decarboxylase n=1 Tax=Aquabacterium sp. A7-Y TaxID=1349605 RepID=UPI00223D7B33|nr:threonine-phosphate decarboxylase [Aquabacterium sp. A7-Y]MCW7539634.1 aminotransferase class I/II-fold pyridoxal phosphate-dependent enzyme [Aquabacterium sp. A7-Y]